ncbi:MAG TPA: cobyrinate a,c-diamide synthase [Coriobacteriia bacterium]|nr:cobyrinate a,c-diamide synthase [Coriobacteriia bacterium]
MNPSHPAVCEEYPRKLKASDSTYPRLMLAAPHGKSGKTVLTLGLLRSLSNAGKSVQAFKKGPDFIDTGWHTLAAGRVGRNLDAYFMDPEQIVGLVRDLSEGVRLSFLEGAMGMYDGLDVEGSCSSAELAKVTDTPVVLVMDVTRMSRTVAALVLGCQNLDPDLKIRGVILNKVRGSRQENLVRAAIAKYCGLPVIGAIPNNDALVIPDRHLGLLSSSEVDAIDGVLDEMAEVVSRYVDMDALVAIADAAGPLPPARYGDRGEAGACGKLSEPRDDTARNRPVSRSIHGELLGAVYSNPPINLPSIHMQIAPCFSIGSIEQQKPRIAVLRDPAFCFYYQENLDALREQGAELVFVNSLQDRSLPADIHACYIGGGFPEVFADVLEANAGFLRSLKNHARRGLPIYAECGGLMLLSRSITDKGKTYNMAGILPMDTIMRKQRQGHGYSSIAFDKPNNWFEQGTVLKGHEYHHSEIINRDAALNCACKVLRGRGFGDTREGISHGEVFASYTHVNVFASPIWAQRMVEKARAFANAPVTVEYAAGQPLNFDYEDAQVLIRA